MPITKEIPYNLKDPIENYCKKHSNRNRRTKIIKHPKI